MTATLIVTQEDVKVRYHLLDRLADARQHSDSLFRLLVPAALYERPIAERHRFIFYVGHLEAFDWNLLHENAFGLKSFHPDFDHLFAFGIDPVGAGLPSDQQSDWPSLEQVRSYVNGVRTKLDERLRREISEVGSVPHNGVSLATLLNVAIEHRLMHVETLAYMLHQLPFEKKVRQGSSPQPVVAPAQPRMVHIPAGTIKLGLAQDENTFGWDNEYEAHTVSVAEFEIDQFMVTNRQYLDFMRDGGYEKRAHWSDGDWAWITANGVSHPVFWKKMNDHWLYRTMFEEVPLPFEWPVYVSQAEASAYARWAGKSLPTEPEWQRAAYGTADDEQTTYPWGNESPTMRFGNFDLSHWDPTPVSAHPSGRSIFDVYGMLGNGWEWTSTVFSPFPGFEPFPFYPGYSANFFDGMHFVMKGGSPRTAACMLRPTFRNWFQAHYQYVYAGFRCVSR